MDGFTPHPCQELSGQSFVEGLTLAPAFCTSPALDGPGTPEVPMGPTQSLSEPRAS